MAKSVKKPKVSVIIPTYNRSHFLSRAIKSVLNQTFQDFELIIVDDGSTDNTKEVIENFQEKDKRIKYIWQKNSGGPAKTRNKGIEKSEGEYIAFLDDDDECLPKKLEKQILLFKESKVPNLGFVGGLDIIVGKKPIKDITPFYKSGNILKDLCFHCIIRTPGTVLVKRSVLQKVGFFDEKFKAADDYDMWIRISQHYSFDYVKENILKYHVHTNNLSQNKETFYQRVEDECFLFKKHENLIKKHPEVYTEKTKALYRWQLLIKRPKEARDYILRAIKDNPFNIKNYLFFLFSFLPKNLSSKLMILKRRYINKIT